MKYISITILILLFVCQQNNYAFTDKQIKTSQKVLMISVLSLVATVTTYFNHKEYEKRDSVLKKYGKPKQIKKLDIGFDSIIIYVYEDKKITTKNGYLVNFEKNN